MKKLAIKDVKELIKITRPENPNTLMYNHESGPLHITDIAFDIKSKYVYIATSGGVLITRPLSELLKKDFTVNG